MTEIESTRNRMRQTLDAELDSFIPTGAVRIWEDETFFEGDYLQKHVLAVHPDDGSVTILRSWMSDPKAAPAVSVDLQMSYGEFAEEIDDQAFPHASSITNNPLEVPFRAHLLGEHTEIVWQSFDDPSHAAFIARTVKAGRDEHVVAGTVTADDGAVKVDIGLRQALASFQPLARNTLAR